jgi:TolB protein
MTVDRIAYVGTDNNIFTISPDGSGSRRLTGNITAGAQGIIQARPLQQVFIFYTWPTWSPDGKKLAVSQVILEGDVPTVSLFTLETSEGELTKVYENEPRASPIIANNVPHYMYWSPNSESLAFIAPTPGGLTLFVHTSNQDNTAISDEGPLYFRWAEDNRSLLIHARDTLLTATAPFGSTLLDLAPMNPIFRAPDLSNDGRQAVYMSNVVQGYGLLVGDPGAAGEFQQLESVGSNAALLWSPTGDSIAVADSESSDDLVHNRLRIISSDGSESRTLVEEPLAAFFWSPNGEKIAYVAVDTQEQSLAWKIVPIEGGEPWELVKFSPSAELLAMISFFDQYAHSHSLWSPDSTRLVFAGGAGRERAETNGASSNVSSIYVINTEPGSLPRKIASGSLAFWSWN